jgi:WD40 repeat protein
MVDHNPEVVTFYSRCSGFRKVSEVKSTPPGQTNHHGHPLHYPTLLQVHKNNLISANTCQGIQYVDTYKNTLTDFDKKHT